MSTQLPETAEKLTTPEKITIVTHSIENDGSLPNLQNLASDTFLQLENFQRNCDRGRIIDFVFLMYKKILQTNYYYIILNTRIFLNFTSLSAMIY
jgi:hypothetical protein